MVAAEAGEAAFDAEFVRSMDTCVQCRGCETACPSSVPFGHLMADTRAALNRQGVSRPPWWMRVGHRSLGHHRFLVGGSRVVAVLQRLRLVPPALGLPTLPLRAAPLRSSGEDVWLFVGCVMDAFQRDVHRAGKDVLEALGLGVAVSPGGAGCCGALAEHAGDAERALDQAGRVMRSFPGEAPIVVDAAGCGAIMKDYGRLLGTAEARRFSARVVDIHEFVAPRIDELELRRSDAPVTIQDPCHLRHVQRSHQAVRLVLARVAPLRETDDDGLCCGAGGAYAFLQPELADAILDRKVAALRRAGAPVVASANPGCMLQLASAGVVVRHPMQLVAEALA